VGRVAACLVALLALGPGTGAAQRSEKRIALVIGNAGYRAGALATPANDAGLVAQTLQAAGFDVVGARDLDQDTLRHALRDFLDQAQAAGPDTVAFVYLSGYGLQLEGENYFVPVDARIARDTDVAIEAVRISDYVRPLAALKLEAGIVVLDAARASPFSLSGAPLAGGLALVEPEPGMLIAFGAAPGTVAPDGQGPYGPYALALAEMMRDGGLPLGELFDRVRLRVNEVTRGAQVPWHAAKVQAPFVFFERTPDAPQPAVSPEQQRAARARPIRDLGAGDAYAAAIDRDTLQGYLEFLDSHPDDLMAPRIRAIVAARREAVTWRRTRLEDTAALYWSYLRRYPEGPHAADARRRLALLSAAIEPPPSFPVFVYDVPPPPPEELGYVDRPVLDFDDPDFAFAPPPPPPAFLLPPPPPDLELLPAPPAPDALFLLPTPQYLPVPVWVRPPATIVPPPAGNVIFHNVHNRVTVDSQRHTLAITRPDGTSATVSPPAVPGAGTAGGHGAIIGPGLPPSVGRKALATEGQPGPAPPPGPLPLPPPPIRLPPHALPRPAGQSPPPQVIRPQTAQPGLLPQQRDAPEQRAEPPGQPQQVDQQRLKQLELERQTQVEQERQRQLEQQRQLQIEQERRAREEQQRQQQLEPQRQQQILPQHQQELQRRQQIQQHELQRQQQMQEQQRLQCGAPGHPPCPR
jgi:uncharacterized caspase-like protein